MGPLWRQGHRRAFYEILALFNSIATVQRVKHFKYPRQAVDWWMVQQNKPGPGGKPGFLSTLGKVMSMMGVNGV